MKQLKYDYSKLDEFLSTEVIPQELAKGFTLLHGGFADLMAQAIVEANCHNLSFIIPEYTTRYLWSLIEMFEIIRELEEVQS